ncbi:MAG: hypothetical protein IJT19_08355 [Bacteroidaceae bacterium]|nr:hypothetical protein [Bacteroidaceae bacterium]
MEPTLQTYQQIERAIRRMAENFPADKDAVMTDIHLQVKPTSGELLAFDDNDEELTRVVVEQWIEAPDDDFYEQAATQICHCLDEMRQQTLDRMSVMHPFSFVLVDEDGETLRDLYVVDEDTVILSSTLLEGLEEDLDQFLANLLKT